jgi:hypothetical protein
VEKERGFGARVAHRIKMTETIKREAKKSHTERQGSELFKFELHPGHDEQRKTKKPINN